MENKNTSSQLPTALKIGNTVTTDKSTTIENFDNHSSTAGHAFPPGYTYPGQQHCTPHSNSPKPSPFLLLPNPFSWICNIWTPTNQPG